MPTPAEFARATNDFLRNEKRRELMARMAADFYAIQPAAGRGFRGWIGEEAYAEMTAAYAADNEFPVGWDERDAKV